MAGDRGLDVGGSAFVLFLVCVGLWLVVFACAMLTDLRARLLAHETACGAALEAAVAQHVAPVLATHGLPPSSVQVGPHQVLVWGTPRSLGGGGGVRGRGGRPVMLHNSTLYFRRFSLPGGETPQQQQQQQQQQQLPPPVVVSNGLHAPVQLPGDAMAQFTVALAAMMATGGGAAGLGASTAMVQAMYQNQQQHQQQQQQQASVV